MKNIVKNPLILLALGVVIVAGSSVGATRAAITYSNNAEAVDFSTSELSVDLQELQGDKYVSVNAVDSLTFPAIAEDMNLNDDDSTNDKPFTIGKKYDEDVRVVNTSAGGYDEYVRVLIRKSWKDGDEKDTILDPKLIQIEFGDGWVEDTNEETAEGQVYYYTKPLAYGDSAQFIKSITINNEVLTYVTTVDGDKTGVVVDEYQYDGKTFYVEIRVDAVQTHHAEEALLGAWGIHATVNDSGEITSLHNN